MKETARTLASRLFFAPGGPGVAVDECYFFTKSLTLSIVTSVTGM
jgi:hypothetical protein